MSMLSTEKSPIMYPIKPIFDHNIKIETPEVMYKSKNFHQEFKTASDVGNPSLDPVAALEKRQESILARLGELRQTLNKLTSQYGEADKTPGDVQKTVLPCQSATAKLTSPLGSTIHDIVISADPEKPPLSLFVLYELIKKQFTVLGTSYVHSSVLSLDPRLKEAILNGSQLSRGSHQLALSLVWKKVDKGPVLMISPTKQTAVTGEVNIARYINRVINPDCEADIVMATQVDEWLDIAHIQIINGNTKEKAAALRNLNSRLGKNDWLVGFSLSLADIVTWSALQQTNQASSAPANVKKWLKKCDEEELFRTAKSLI